MYNRLWVRVRSTDPVLDWIVKSEANYICQNHFRPPGSDIFLGFTGTFCSKSEWGSTQNVLIIILYWGKQISRNCTYLLSNTRSIHTVKNYFTPMTVYRFGVDPSEIYDVT